MDKRFLLLLFVPFFLALTVTDVVTPGRVSNGTLISDYDEDPEVPVFGNIQNSGNGNVTITWAQVTQDTQGNPITLKNYELRYKITTDTVYTLVIVPPEFVGHALTLTSGNYQYYVSAVDSNGNISDSAIETFTVN